LEVFVEDWQAAYGSPYLVLADDTGDGRAEPVEDGGELRPRQPPAPSAGLRIAFVDGVRRGEAALYQRDERTGTIVSGAAGSHACGAVLAGDGRLQHAHERVRRLVIWGGGLAGELPEVAGGWSWTSRSTASLEPDAPLKDLQARMRQAEGMLAEELSENGYLVVVDGPLNYVRSRDLPVVGYVKTHHRALLAPEHHRLVPELGPGLRTSLFRLSDRYSCYLRLAAPGPLSGPWAGIVRLEVPQSAGLAAAVAVVDSVAATVPRYAGVAHRDPRAPQNLQPIGALETHLRHLLGDPRLAYRAVRAAVAARAVAEPA
jgi:hypothetical protein